MKLKQIYFLSLLIGLIGCQTKAIYERVPSGVNIALPEGTLAIHPLSDNALRIKYFEGIEIDVPEFVLIPNNENPEFKISESRKSIRISLKKMSVEVDKRTGSLTYLDPSGNVLLREIAGSRKFISDSIMGEPSFFVEQSFDSPPGESIFGLGQFQDGHFNLKGKTRRLTQVNSQIAIPFIYSSRGFGILWHQYGLTDFNPVDNFITLVEQERAVGGEHMAEVTTTAGTQKVSQDQSLYVGTFTVPKDGEYSIFLDLGGMGNRHYVSINGVPVIDQSNMWLPPTVGTLVHLNAGEHNVQVVCKSDNKPTLSWGLKKDITTFRSPIARKLDYIVFAGSADEVISSYRNLTGNAPLFPIWAYGFWQSRERYTSSTQLVETVKEFRRRRLPMDVIVQDWQYWGDKGWGVPQFDEKSYPNPSGFIRELHDLNAHFAVSIWSNPDRNSELGRQYVANNRFIPNTRWLDYFNPKTRQDYWTTLNENMFAHGVDSWWMDAVEPENDALRGVRTYIGLGYFYRLIYPLMVGKAVYEGQRETSDQKRVCILTRSAFSGLQRYGVINWSGDIGSDWDAYRRQIVAGLNFTITGLPYWTTDIGGFFRPPSQYTDENYHELLIRWFQWGAFKPIFRIHGYRSETEPWKFGEIVEQNMRKMLDLRYRLIPYIYSEAWQITNYGSTLMRPLVMDFNNDPEAVKQPHQYMFGRAFLVAPVTEPSVTMQNVYLPEGSSWFDFWTGIKYEGGQSIQAKTPLDIIPLYVRAGSILPIGPKVQFTTEKPWDNLEIRIYEGANGEFTLYEDEGDNYNYETGAYSTITFRWDDVQKVLTISDRKGSFQGMLAERKFNILKVSRGKGIGNEITVNYDKVVSYSGKEIKVQL